MPGGFGGGPMAAPSGATKRPALAQAGAAAKAPRAAEAQVSESSIIVFSTAERDEIGIRTLVGEYREEGSNHGRRFYRKSQKIPGHEDVDVFLYFWDERDGPAFSGWWFGNQVGGAQVWSRNRQCTQAPPRTGWTIPWDGEVKKELVVMSSVEKLAIDRKQAQARLELRRKEEDEAQNADWDGRIQQVANRAAELQDDVTQAVKAAKEALEDNFDEQAFQKAAQGLQSQAASLVDAQRFFAQEVLAAQKAPPNVRAELTTVGGIVRRLQAEVKEELQKMRERKLIQVKQAEVEEEQKTPEEEERERELESVHSKQLEEMMPAAMERVDTAEDEVEKVAIAAAPLQIDSADDLRPVMLQAIKETEQRVRAAQAAIGEARRFISGKLSLVQRFTASVKKAAAEEFTTLQGKLNDAQNKLNPYKAVRQDYESRVQAKKLYEELSGKLAGAEIEVEKAAMMTAPLGSDGSESIKETEAALTAAQTALSQTSRLLDSKLRLSEKNTSPLMDEIKALQERAKMAQEKLDEVRKSVKETQVRIAADTLLREVSEKVAIAEDELQRMAEAELPFLRADKGQDTEALLGDAEQIATKVHTALAEAQTFVARKLVEVARFTEGSARTVKEEIDMLQKRLEEGRERLTQFRSSLADRKRGHLLEAVEAKVSQAESEVQKMAEATTALNSVGSAGEAVPEGLAEAVEQANRAERAAQSAIVNSRAVLLQKTAELKKLAVASSGSGSELGKLQTRVNNIQQEVAKMRNAIKDAEERIRVKQMLAEVAIRLQAAESDVDKVASFAVPVADEQPSAEAVERMDKATTSAQNKLNTTAKLVDVKLKTAQGFLREELLGMRERISRAERKLAEVIKSAKEQKERLLAADLLAEVTEKVEMAEAEVQTTSEAELPFLKGIEVLAAGEAMKAVIACEGLATGAQKAIADARTFLVQKLADAKQFSDGPAESCSKELMTLQKRLDVSAAKLAELKKDTGDRKRKFQMQASSEKVAGVEAAVQNLASEMTKFAEDKLSDLSADEARTVCEGIAEAEQQAQSAVAEARKFLALRVQEVKSLGEAQRGAQTADLSKLQSRLTQCQVELAKLSKQVTEREQRFVAQKLIKDATEELAKLQADIERAAKVTAPLLADDRAELLRSACEQALVLALQAYAKKSGNSAESIFLTISQSQTAKAAEFGTFLDSLAELSGRPDATFTEQQAAAIFERLAGPSGELSASAFQALLRERQVCTAAVLATDAPEGSGVVGNVEAGEAVEVLETQEKDGIVKAKCVLVRDGTTAWVTLATSDGSNFKLSPAVGRLESIEAHLKAVHARTTESAEAMGQKAIEVAAVKQGPLAEIKAKLIQTRTQATQEQSKIDQLRKRASAASTAVLQQRKEELQKVQEVKFKAWATKSVQESTAAVEGAEAKASKVIESAKAGSAEKLQQELGVPELERLRDLAEEALEALAKAKAMVAAALESHDSIKGHARSALLEARVELTKLTARASTAERKCRTATDAVRTAYQQVVKTVSQQARAAMRSAVRKSGKTSDEVFTQVAVGKPAISAAQFSAFVKTLPDQKLSNDQVQLVFREFGGADGLRKPDFARVVQEFVKCDKEVSLTDKLDISESKTVRKIENGETIEVLEGPVEEPSTSVFRIRGRMLRDSQEGWVTLKSNQGTLYLKPTPKPFLAAVREVSLLRDFDESSSVVRKLAPDEVMELLEGPREQETAIEPFLHVKAADGASGWISLQLASGGAVASRSEKVFVCRSTIAMTDIFDIQGCTVVRKVEVGEALIIAGGAEGQDDVDRDIKRLQFRAARDGKEGWVTLQGNQGTVFVEPSQSHYIVDAPVSLREGIAKDSAEVRLLDEGEVLEALEPPREARPEAKMGLRARALQDGQAGWLTFGKKAAPPVKVHSGKAAPAAAAAAPAKTEGR